MNRHTLEESQPEVATPECEATVAMLLYPGLTVLDLIGPQLPFSFLPGRCTQLVWKNRDIIVSDTGVPIQPTMTFDETPEEVEILFVPGGTAGTWAAMEDPEILDFVASRGKRATYVTSVCTGSLLLGAAGLLEGYRATSHWSVRNRLPMFGAVQVNERVVFDRNRITGGGITAGIDFGLTLLAHLAGEEFAKGIQLYMEYVPEPPFKIEIPGEDGPEITAQVSDLVAPLARPPRGASG